MTHPALGAVLAAVPDGSVEVLGTGAWATTLREALADRAAGGAPTVIVDAGGDPAQVLAALERLDDLGTLVLAAPLPPGPVVMDLYADVHVRGLTVVGVVDPGP